MSELINILKSSYTDIIYSFLVTILIALITVVVNRKIIRRNKSSATSIITSVLDHAIITLTTKTKYKMRANVFLPIKKNPLMLRLKYKSSNMETSPDTNLTLEKWHGCTGFSWGYELPLVGDLSNPEVNGQTWGLKPEEELITKHIVSIMSYPIRHPKDTQKIVGILNFDSDENLADYFSSEEVQDTASIIAAEIGEILYFLGLI